MPIVESASTVKLSTAFAGAVGLASIWAGVEPYIPFVIGGLVLFSYMVSHDETELTFKNGSIIVGGALLVAYLTLGLTLPLAEGVYHLLLGFLDKEVIEKSTYLTNGEGIQALSNTISFGLGALSRSIYKKFFSNRDNIVMSVKGIRGKKEQDDFDEFGGGYHNKGNRER